MVQAVTVGAVSHESFGTYLFPCPEIEQQVVTANKTITHILSFVLLVWLGMIGHVSRFFQQNIILPCGKCFQNFIL
jgi:hypothetical protein